MSIGLILIAVISIFNVILVGRVIYKFLIRTNAGLEEMPEVQSNVILSLHDLTSGLGHLVRGTAAPMAISEPMLTTQGLQFQIPNEKINTSDHTPNIPEGNFLMDTNKKKEKARASV